MKIFKNKNTLINEISGLKNISFVPTMGGLHKGHESLIKNAKQKKGKVLVSIYVNPKQFNSKKDYFSYPINLKKDIAALKKLKINYLFIPTYKDIFMFNTKKNIFKHKLIRILCGKYRKFHFNGVLEVVNRFLEIIKPKYIYLGKKDFQQLFLIKEHIKKRRIPTKVVECKTIREKSGLALSSRNLLLNSQNKADASKVYSILVKHKRFIKRIKKNNFNLQLIRNKLSKIGINKIDYLKC